MSHFRKYLHLCHHVIHLNWWPRLQPVQNCMMNLNFVQLLYKLPSHFISKIMQLLDNQSILQDLRKILLFQLKNHGQLSLSSKINLAFLRIIGRSLDTTLYNSIKKDRKLESISNLLFISFEAILKIYTCPSNLCTARSRKMEYYN